MNNGLLNSKQVGIKIRFAHPKADLTGQPGVQLIFSHGIELGAVAIGSGIFRIKRHVDGGCGYGNFVNSFPWHFEIRATRANHAYLGIGIAGFFLFT